VHREKLRHVLDTGSPPDDAERAVLGASTGSSIRPEIVVYLNRLSDLLFVSARRANQAAKTPDVPWAPRS